VHGMENCEGLEMELAFTLAKKLNLKRFFSEARRDERVFRRVVDLMATLATEPQPLGGLADLPDGEKVYAGFLATLSEREPEINALYAMDALRDFLQEQAGGWESRDERLADLNARWERAFSSERVRAGFDDEDRSWFAYDLVKRYELTDLLDEVRTRFRKDPELGAISVLAHFARKKDLQALMDSIGRVSDMEWRSRHSIGGPAPWGPQHERSVEYAEIVGALGPLGTPEAVRVLARAMCDYEGTVRAAALRAAAALPTGMRNGELLELVRERLCDPSDTAALEAVLAAKKFDIRLDGEEFAAVVSARTEPAAEFLSALRALRA